MGNVARRRTGRTPIHRSPSPRRLAVVALGAAALVASLALPATAAPADPERLANLLVRAADIADANTWAMSTGRHFDRNIDAVAYSVGKYALSTADVNGVEGRKQKAAARASAAKVAATVAPQLHADTA